MNQPIYLDANATTTMLPDVITRIDEVIGVGPLNTSSLHGAGDKTRQILTQSRDQNCNFIWPSRPRKLDIHFGGN